MSAAQYFWPDVLRWYTDHPERWTVEDSTIDGTILVRDRYFLSLPEETRDEETFARLRYDKRRLRDGRQVLLPWPPDFDALPEKERLRWEPHGVDNPEFAENDPEFEAAVRQNLQAEDIETPDDPIFDISQALRRINRLRPLFRYEENPYLMYLHLNNEKNYSESHNQLRKLVGPDGFNVKQIKNLLTCLGVGFTKDDKPWALFKTLVMTLAGDRHTDILGPLERIPRKRSPLTHEIRKFQHTGDDYVEMFKRDCRDVARALDVLADSLEAHLKEVSRGVVAAAADE